MHEVVVRQRPQGRVCIEYDLEDADAMAQLRAHTDTVVEDTVAWFRRRQELVDFGGVTEAHVRYIARAAARLALLAERNPDRPRR